MGKVKIPPTDCPATPTPTLMPTPTQTPIPTRTPTPTPTPTPSACSPRPPVAVAVVPAGQGRLQATIRHGTQPATPNNRLVRVRATIPPNARVDVLYGPTDLAGEQLLPIGNGTQPVVLVVRRVAAGAVTVHIVVTDRCGDWNTFVGGGANAF